MRVRLAIVSILAAALLAGCGPLLILRAKSGEPPHLRAARDHIREHHQADCGSCHRSMR